MGDKIARRRVWIGRGALLTLGLAGAVYAADQAAGPTVDDLSKTIMNQRIREGVRAKPERDPAHQDERLTPDQMVELAGRYDADSKVALEHARKIRTDADRARDPIRVACIEDKLTQMRDIMRGAEPLRRTLPHLSENELVMRQHYLVLQLARDRMLELLVEVEACMGDVLDAHLVGQFKDDSTFDPTRPPAPGQEIERPGEASPYR
jgi:hypothetical protein